MDVGDLGRVAGQLPGRPCERAVFGRAADQEVDGPAGLAVGGEDDLDALALVELDRLRDAVRGRLFAALGTALGSLALGVRQDGFLNVRAGGKPAGRAQRRKDQRPIEVPTDGGGTNRRTEGARTHGEQRVDYRGPPTYHGCSAKVQAYPSTFTHESFRVV